MRKIKIKTIELLFHYIFLSENENMKTPLDQNLYQLQDSLVATVNVENFQILKVDAFFIASHQSLIQIEYRMSTP